MFDADGNLKVEHKLVDTNGNFHGRGLPFPPAAVVAPGFIFFKLVERVVVLSGMLSRVCGWLRS